MKFFVMLVLLSLTDFANAEKFVPVCLRPEYIRVALESTIKKPCRFITEQHLQGINEIKIESFERLRIEPQDFSGLSNLLEIRFRYGHDLEFAPNALSELPSLIHLTFDRVYIPVLSAKTIPHLPGLKQLIFENCNIAHLEPGAFHGLTDLRTIVLVGAHLRKIKRGVFTELPNLAHVTLIDAFKLEEIEDEAFFGLPSLQSVSVGNLVNPSSHLARTKKAAFRGVPEVHGLPPTFDVDPSTEQWGGQ